MPLKAIGPNGEIPYEFMQSDSAYTETWTEEGPEIVHVIQIPWSYMDDAPVAFLGDAVGGPAKNGEGNAITRFLPHPHPFRSKLYASELRLRTGQGYIDVDATSLRPVFRDSSSGIDGYAIYEVVYRHRNYELTGNLTTAWVEKQFVYGLDTYKLPGQSFVFGTPLGAEKKQGEKINLPYRHLPEGIAITRPLIELRYIWHWVPESAIPRNNWNKLIGFVNEDGFDHDHLGAIGSPGNLLATPPQVSKRMMTPSGTYVRDVTYVFSVRPDTGWNRIYRAPANNWPGGFDEVRKHDGDYKPVAGNRPDAHPYKKARLEALFVPSQVAEPA